MTADAGVHPWVMGRIGEALDQAVLVRAAATDLEDHVLISATERLADDLEAFAVSQAARLSELEVPAAVGNGRE